DPNAIYSVFFPQNVHIKMAGGTSCAQFGGYHHAVKVSGVAVAYAVIPTCPGFDGRENADAITAPASHEFVEAATDPFPPGDFAYAQIDQAHAVYGVAPGTELADMCSYDSDAFYKPAGLDFLVQRIWSNAAALSGGDPCAPIPAGHVYYGAIPDFVDDVTIHATSFSQSLTGTTKGVRVPLGQSAQVAIDLFSTAAMDAPFTVKVVDAPTFFGTGSAELQIVLDSDNGNNGDVLHATITRLKNGASNGTELVVVAGTSASYHTTFGFAAN
ncbi:MAG: hypothetical protein ABI461_05905, partial [Polyangiaceae bacterium]